MSTLTHAMAIITNVWKDEAKEFKKMKGMQHLNMLVWGVILVVGLVFQPAFGQTEQNIGFFYPYPSEDEVNDSEFSSEGFDVSPLSADDINEDFSNIEDLTWLQSIAKEHRVVLLGESHYFQYIKHLRNRILFALNTFNRYPYLILERPYSWTPYINHYIFLDDNEEASQFEHDNNVLFVTESDYQLFQHLRRWNRTHPDKTIQVGCPDIEHDHSLTFGHIVFPYVKAIVESYPADATRLQVNLDQLAQAFERIYNSHYMTSPDELNNAFRQIEECVAVAREQQFMGTYSFLTPEYIENVIENLKSTYNADSQDFTRYRQHAIIRNLTDSRFLGQYFIAGKVLLHAGGYHAPTHHPYPKGQNFLREGSYLTYEFDLTKGRSYSLGIWGFGVSSLLEMKDVDLDAVWRHLAGTNYGRMVRTIQQGAAYGLIAPDTAYYALADGYRQALTPGVVAFMKRVLSLAYHHHNQPLLFQQIPWDSLLEQGQQIWPEHHENLVQFQSALQRHDLNIMVPVSPLILPRKRME